MASIHNKTVTENEGKTIAIIAYITLIGLIIAFVMNSEKKNEFARYHIKQSLGLALTGLTLLIIGLIPILGWLINIVGIFVLLYLWIMGLINAINGNEKPLPILGHKYLEWFKNL
ncbi:hypothetical protein ADIWIN_1777 [Winogradskyella psychrotolerans RS-3]|uniref:Uncharacterized protein n=1 Tax=Winogradskyella psychrotolerans RS-3 TaxID=641526 RepID=S7VTF4_9FLAO|nr:hypothetical protein [Winogradskyella psychrotolerans]EPR73346.1 hypothetical protein ADIWIN_1777 [Winogradskyella psychrotolerans RS-3]